jgi:hypothetical protein
MPRGRPKGSKNKNGRSDYVIGTGKERYTFPIVRNGNVRQHVAKLYVNGESFAESLRMALDWAKVYSDSRGVSFWPLIKYKSLTPELRYVKKIDGNFIYTESKDAIAWLPLVLLEAI